MLRARTAASNGGSGPSGVKFAYITANGKRPAERFRIGRVDGQTFRDVFEVARSYLKNGELVDLYDNYDNAKCYLSEDGLSGFAIEPDGNLVSVFSLRRGSLSAMSGMILRAGARKLDAYNSVNQPLKIYEDVLGFKLASDMEYNMAFDHDNIAANHGNPNVVFMILPKPGNEVETRRFTKDQYDAASDWQSKQLDRPAKLLSRKADDASRRRMYDFWLWGEGDGDAKLPDTPENRAKFEKVMKEEDAERRKLYRTLGKQRVGLRERGLKPAYVNWLTERGLEHNDALLADWESHYAKKPAPVAKEQPKPPKLRMAPTPEEEAASDAAMAATELPAAREERLRKEGRETSAEPVEGLDASVDGVVELAKTAFDVGRADDKGDVAYAEQVREAVKGLTEPERIQYAKLLDAYNRAIDEYGYGARETKDAADRRNGWEEAHGMLLGRKVATPKLELAADAEAKPQEPKVSEIERIERDARRQAEERERRIAETKAAEAAEEARRKQETDKLVGFLPEDVRGKATFERTDGGFRILVDGKDTGVNIDADGRFSVGGQNGTLSDFGRARELAAFNRSAFKTGDRVAFRADDGSLVSGTAIVSPDGKMTIRTREKDPRNPFASVTKDVPVPDEKRGDVQRVGLRNSRKSETVPEAWDAAERERVGKAADMAKGWIRGVKVRFADGAEEGAEGRALRDRDGNVVGSYDRATNEVTLFPGASVDTVSHEIGWHATYKFAEDEAAAGRTQLKRTLDDYIDNAPKAVKDAVKAAYGDFSPEALRDEIGAHLFERDHGPELAKALRTLEGRAWYRKVWDAVKGAWRSMMERFGVETNRVDLAKLDRMTPEEGMAWLAKQMAEGKTLGSVGGKGEGARKSIPNLYTGSAADYEKPSLLKVGTGEGSQVYGWGLYASSERGVADGYAGTRKREADLEGGDAAYKKARKNVDKLAAKMSIAKNDIERLWNDINDVGSDAPEELLNTARDVAEWGAGAKGSNGCRGSRSSCRRCARSSCRPSPSATRSPTTSNPSRRSSAAMG